MAVDLALYIHWPFCQSKCPYCDFNSHVASVIDQTAWRKAYKAELAYYAALLPERRITSVFFGGGTPSLMPPETTALILDEASRHWSFSPDCEITLEANPGSAEAEAFVGFKAAGVNRLSLGVQSLNDDALVFLGRRHNAAEARRAIALAHKLFPRYSFDLIYARHGQSLESWQAELTEALALVNGHLSLYQLTIESGTQFYTLHQRGVALIPPEDHAAALYECTAMLMDKAGLPSYEISNHAAKGLESRHNLTYWHYEDYIGIGPGAHGRYQKAGQRYAAEDHRAPDFWLGQVSEKGHGIRQTELVTTPIAQREALMMGLRLTEGIEASSWLEKFSQNLAVGDNPFLLSDKIKRLESEGYIVKEQTRLRATPAGLQRLNAILDYLLN